MPYTKQQKDTLIALGTSAIVVFLLMKYVFDGLVSRLPIGYKIGVFLFCWVIGSSMGIKMFAKNQSVLNQYKN